MKEKKGNFLPWPWNIVVYVLLVIVLRLFAIPIILIMVWIRQKNNPNGVQEGYCLSRTRKKISWVMWSVLCLAFSGASLWLLSIGLQQDQPYGKNVDNGTLIASGVVGGLFLLMGLYMVFHGVKDTFFPEKSALANSIRSQLPYPEEAPPVKELFALVPVATVAEGEGLGDDPPFGVDDARHMAALGNVNSNDEHRQTPSCLNSQTVLPLL